MVVVHRTLPSRHVPAQGCDRRDNLCDITDDDHALFAIYQSSNGAPYDLTNPFDRTNIARVIRKAADNREDRITATDALYRIGLINRSQYLERTNEAALQHRRHLAALFRLGEIGRY